MDGKLLERCVVTIIADKIDSGQIPGVRTHRDFGTKAFGDELLWKRIKIGGRQGKMQGLTIEHALKMAEAVGTPLSELIVEAKLKVEAGWTLDDDTSTRKLSTGRPKKTTEPVPDGAANHRDPVIQAETT